MTLPRRYYDDPAKHVKFESETACVGCMYLSKVWNQELCEKHRRKPADKLKRCRAYDKGEHNVA